MKTLIVVFLMLFLSGCEAQSIKKVGYGKTFDAKIDEACFETLFAELKESSHYILSVETKGSGTVVLSYELTIDGQKTSESHDVFTPASFKLAKNFLALVSERCTS